MTVIEWNICDGFANRRILFDSGYAFFEDMAFVALLTRDVDVERAIRRPVATRHVVARVGSWARLLHTVRERPVVCALIDESSLPRGGDPRGVRAELRERFPSVPLLWIARPSADPFHLLELGRSGIDCLLLLALDDVEREVPASLARGLSRGTEALVTREVSPYFPARVMRALRAALDGVHRRAGADEFAASQGFSRPHLSVLLKERGLPSVGHLLVWARLLHAGRWLADPGRSAQSVSRQLDYSTGAAFRRTLRNYLGASPTEVIRGGGFPFVMRHFMDRCGIARPSRSGRTAA